MEYHFNEKEAQDYVIGCRKLIRNDRPIIGTYGVNNSGSGDMYYKGGNMLHTLRHIINDDEKWRNILRGLNAQFWHQTVTTDQVESFISKKSGIDFGKFFDQYLRTSDIPVLKTRTDGKQLSYHWDKTVDGFQFPIRVKINGQEITLTPTKKIQTYTADADINEFELDRNFYMNVEEF